MRRISPTFAESVRFLYYPGNESKTAKLGLETVSGLLARLVRPRGN
jgi:hypothetical protein